MLKMNRTSKLFNSLALVAALTVSTAVYAMEPDQEQEVTVTKQSPVNEALMEEARRIAREKVLENLYGYSDYFFSKEKEMVYIIKSSVVKVDKPLYDSEIHYFNKNFLSHPSGVPTFNRDILAFLEHGTTPIYCNYEGALFGVAQALNKAGITLEALVGKIDAVKEVVKEESTPS